MSSPSKTQRWLDLIAYLVGRRVPVSFEQLMEGVPPYAADYRDADDTGLASLRRTFERDKKELRELGIPIETIDYRINYGRESIRGYRLAAEDFYLPYLELVSGETSAEASSSPAAASFTVREEEARAALDALHRVAGMPGSPLRREARSAIRKLTFDLGDRLGIEPGDEAPVDYLAPPGSEDLREGVRLLSDALVRRKRVAFRYRGIRRGGDPTDRRVHPYGLLFQHSHWYLIGHDLDREALRVFRLARMEAIEVHRSKPGTPDYEVPDDFTLADHAGRPPWALAGEEEEPVDVTVRLAFPRSLWAERNHHGERVAEHDDGSQTRRFRVQDPGPFLRWMLTLGPDAGIESPEEFGDELTRLAARVAAAHGPADDEGADG